MNISTKGRYALRALVELARHGLDQKLSVKQISDIQDISQTYLEHILIDLKKAGIVDSDRGVYGGYYLQKSPSEITLCEVLEAVEGPIYLSKCLKHGNPVDCKFIKDCDMQDFWGKLSRTIEDLFKSITLKEILGDENNESGE